MSRWLKGILARALALAFVLPGFVGASQALAQTPAPIAEAPSTSPVEASSFRLRLGSSSAAEDIGTKTSEMFGKLVELKSKERVKFEFYSEGKLGKNDEILAKVLKGEAEGFTESISNLTSKIPYASVLEMPLAFATPLDAWIALDGVLGEAVKRDFEKLNLKILAFQDYGGRDFIMASHPIAKAEDLKGLKMRCMATSPVQVKMYESWGAQPIPTTSTEILGFLKAGKIDGFDFPIAGLESRQLNQASKYVALVSLYRVVNPITVSKAWYDGLPHDLQDIVSDSARIAADWGRMSQERERMAAAARLEKLGMKVNVLDPAEISKLRALLKPLYDDMRRQYPKEIMELILGAQ